ncbi:MAG: ABC transporter permease, partial [Betaproteobacteria bacterium]
MLRLEPRATPSQAMTLASPVLALLLTAAVAALILAGLGKDPLSGLQVLFLEPLSDRRQITEVLLKATPLIVIALGLAVCYRANVWNIGAEGQLIAGAIAGGGVALLATRASGGEMVMAVLVAAALGGMAWAAITAWLKDRFNANEILVSLMLVYVAQLLLSYMVHGPWRDPAGMGFPQSALFERAARMPLLLEGTRLH